MPQLIKKPVDLKKLSLKDFHQKRNNVLIWHDKGGLGDVFMQRMMLNDFKRIMPESEITFACLPEYISAVTDHPDIHSVIDSRTVETNNYINYYNTCVTVADRYENRLSPCQEHRSDIWAKYCGYELTDHDMKIRIDKTLKIETKEKFDKLKGNKPLVLFAPVSKMLTKTLLPNQIKCIMEATKHCKVVGIHNREIEELKKYDAPTLHKNSIPELISYINEADYVISVDTAAFHIAGGLNKPLTGIFTFADGKVYGKYFDFVLVQKHRDDGNWECGPCFKFGDCPKCRTQPKPCLTELTEAELVAGVEKMFQKWPENSLKRKNLI